MVNKIYEIFSSAEHSKASDAAANGSIVVYNMGSAIREIDADGRCLPIGHYGCLAKSNSILENLVKAGFLQQVGGEAATPQKKATPKKKPLISEVVAVEKKEEKKEVDPDTEG
jgi:hypothetical protein